MLKRILLLVFLSLPLAAQAELVVVAGAGSQLGELSENEVRQLFTGQTRAIKGERIQTLDLPVNEAARIEFYQKLLNRSPDQMRSYWARMIFTGQGQPPREVSGQREMKLLVGSSANQVGYLPADEVDDSLRVLFRLN